MSVLSRERRRRGILRSAALVLLGAMGGWTANEIASSDAKPPLPTSEYPAPMDTAAPETFHVPAGSMTPDSGLLGFWSKAAFGLATRSVELEDLLAELQSQNEDPRKALNRAIEASSDVELATIVAAVTRIDAGELLASQDLRPFATRLAEVALDGLDGPSIEPEPASAVYFTSTTQDFDPDASTESEFPIDQGRIFARIELDDFSGDGLLVKWRHKQSNRIHSLQSMHYTASSGPAWSYLSRDSDWEPGEYQVDVYSQDERMVPLARGHYTVF